METEALGKKDRMIDALLRGKVSRQLDGMEDVLTSCVFGILQHEPQEALLPFLSLAEDIDGRHPLEGAQLCLGLYSCSFWRWIDSGHGAGCEPDVLIRLVDEAGQEPKASWLVLVEAKFRHGKSSTAGNSQHPRDQLAREWDNLVHLAACEGDSPILVYLTADLSMPREEMRDSIADFESTRGPGISINLAWISWRQLDGLLLDSGGFYHQKLRELLERLGLQSFSGIRKPKSPNIPWQMRSSFSFLPRASPTIPWRFADGH